jgi:hypothetical protein
MNATIPTDFQEIRSAVQKSLDEYVALGTAAQDDLLNLANQQLAAYRQVSEFAVRNQENLLAQFEVATKNTSQIWLDGVRTWSESLPRFPGFAG